MGVASVTEKQQVHASHSGCLFQELRCANEVNVKHQGSVVDMASEQKISFDSIHPHSAVRSTGYMSHWRVPCPREHQMTWTNALEVFEKYSLVEKMKNKNVSCVTKDFPSMQDETQGLP